MILYKNLLIVNRYENGELINFLIKNGINFGSNVWYKINNSDQLVLYFNDVVFSNKITTECKNLNSIIGKNPSIVDILVSKTHKTNLLKDIMLSRITLQKNHNLQNILNLILDYVYESIKYLNIKKNNFDNLNLTLWIDPDIYFSFSKELANANYILENNKCNRKITYNEVYYKKYNNQFKHSTMNTNVFSQQPANTNVFGKQPANTNMFNQQPANMFGKQPANTNMFGKQPANTNMFGKQPANTNMFSQKPANTNMFNQKPEKTNMFNQQQANTNGFGKQPVNTNGFGQQPVNTNMFSQKSVNTNMFSQKPVNTNGFGQQPVNTNGFGQQPVNTNGFGQQPVNTNIWSFANQNKSYMKK